MADPTGAPGGVPDGEEVAREAILEVQLAFAGTLVATGTALAWYALGAIRDAGLDSVVGLFGGLLGVAVLQLYVVDHSWFLLLRGAWLSSVLVARQDQRNLADRGYVAQLEALYDRGSVRFQRGLAHLLEGAFQLGALVGGWNAVVADGLAWRVLWTTLGVTCAVILADRSVLGRVGVWRDRVRPRLYGSRWPWVDPPFGTAHRIGAMERGIRLALGGCLVVADLVWVVDPALVADREVVHRGDDVVLRFHLGGLRPSEDAVQVALTSDTVDPAVLRSGMTWMGDGPLILVPTAGLAEGRHTVTAKVTVHQAHAELTIGAEPAVFVVLPEGG